MPSWGKLLRELAELKQQGHASPPDLVRRKYIATAHQLSKRAVILYATKWTSPDPEVPPDAISITAEDVQGFMEVIHGVKEQELDLVLHSPGGSIEAAEAIVNYLRSKFRYIRVIVPHAAMSAATMISCAADEVVLGSHSSLGPTDPQFILQTALGPRVVPAQLILAQFEKAQIDCQDPRKLASWLPMLNQYGPDLLLRSETVGRLAESLVTQWLERWMFKSEGAAAAGKAQAVAKWLSNHRNFGSHGRFLSREELGQQGLNVKHLEANNDEQDAFLSLYHATTHTFESTGAVKIIENHLGNAYIKQIHKVLVQGSGEKPSAARLASAPLPAPAARPSPPFPKKKR